MTQEPGVAQGRHRIRSARPGGLLRTNALMAVSSVVVGLTSYACALLMARLLSPADYSDFSAGQTLLTIVGVTAAAMIPMPLARVVRTHGHGSDERRRSVGFAVYVSLLIGLVAGGALMAVAGLFARPGVGLVIGACGLGLFAIMPVWGWLQGEARFTLYVLLSLAEVTLRLALSVACALAGLGAKGVLASYLAGIALVLFTGVVLMRHDFSGRARVLADASRWRETSGVALVQLAVSALVSSDVVLVAIMAGTTASGAGYQAIATLAKGPVYVAAGTAVISFPALSAAKPGETANLIRSTLHSFGWLAIPSAAVLATVPAQLALWALPARYAPSFSLLPWLAADGLELGAVSVLAVVLLAVGAYRRSMAAVAASAVFVLGGMAAGWRADTIQGLAVGIALGGLGALITTLAIAHRHISSSWTRRAVVALAGAAAGAAVLFAVRPIAWLWLAMVTIVAVAVVRRIRRRASVKRPAPAPGGLTVTQLGFEDPAMPGAGGGSHRTHEIGRRLAARGHRITVLVTRFPGWVDRRQDDVEYVHVGIGKGKTRVTRVLGYMLMLPVVVRRYPSDLVAEEFFAPISSMAAPLWSGRPTVGVVQWLNARDKARQYHLPVQLVEKFGVRHHTHIIAVSAGIKRQITELNPGARTIIVGNGVDPRAFAVEAERGPDVVFVGRLEVAQKGLDLLLQAWALAAPQVPGQLVVAGSGPDEVAVRRLASKLGIADRVRFAGWVSGMAKYELMAAAKLVVVPSRFETFGIVAIESLAVGTPVLAFDIDCLREVVPTRCGRLVAPFDTEAYAAALVNLYRQDNWREQARSQGRNFASSYDWEALAIQQETFYKSVVTHDTEPASQPAASQPAAGDPRPGDRGDEVRKQLRGLGHRRTRGQRGSRVALVGNAGNGNTGDEALLAVTLAGLDPDARPTVISRDPVQVTALHGVPATTMSLRGALPALLRCDALVVVGGGMFGPGLPPLVRLLPTLATWVRRGGRSVAYVAIGVYPGTPGRTLRALRRAAERSEVTVRDDLSVRTLNVKRSVECVGDLAWHLAPAEGALARKMLMESGIPVDQPLLLVSPKAAPTDAETDLVIDVLTAAVQYWTENGGVVAAIALSGHVDFGRNPAMTDSGMAGIIAERAGAEIPVVGPYLPPSLAKAVVGQASAVVGYRFHAIVFALSMGIGCMGISGEPKTDALLVEHQVPAFEGVGQLQHWIEDNFKLLTELASTVDLRE